MAKYQNILIVGIGLIGGSLAKRISQKYHDASLYGLDVKSSEIKLQCEDLFYLVTDQVKELPTHIDLAFICTPIDQVVSTFQALGAHIETPLILSDVSSVKGPIIQQLPTLKKDHYFFSIHPMAGKEVGGFINSEASLFDQKTFVLFPQECLEYITFKRFIAGLDVQIVECDIETHDRLVALLSHFPYLISSLLMQLVKGLSEDEQKLCFSLMGPAFKDMTRVSSSDSSWGRDVCVGNKENILSVFDMFALNYEHLKQLILQADGLRVKQFLEKIKTFSSKKQ